MLINTINRTPLALPYAGITGVVPVDKRSEWFSLDDDAASGRQTRPRITTVEHVNAAVGDQQRQQAQRINSQILIRDGGTSSPGTSSTARVLGELINRMGGSGIYSGPGKLLNIAV